MMRLLLDGGLFKAWGVNRFPDGQIQFWADQRFIGGFDLEASIRTSEELDLFFQAIATVPLNSIRVNYLYGARSDKDRAGERLVANVPAMFDTIVAKLLRRSRGFPTLMEVVMPHCEVDSMWSIVAPIHPEILANEPGYDLILYPDQSAQRRFSSYLQVLGLPEVTCSKVRDQVTGEIIRHEVPRLHPQSKVLVVDDLCDGGRTFMDIGQATVAQTIDLYVTHGVFSNSALDKLFGIYGTIWTTNSYDDQPTHPSLRTLSVWRQDATVKEVAHV